MKKVITLLLMVLMIQVSFAQEEKAKDKDEMDEMNTIFTKDNLKVTGGFIVPELKTGNVNEDASLLLGGRLGMTFNDRFTLGLGGYGLVNNSNFDTGDPIYPTARIGMGYGGLAMEYTFFTNKKVHFSIPVLVGVAGIYVYEDDDDFFNNEWNEIENSAAMVIEPGVNVELNLFKFFRVDLGASYRWITESDLQYLTDEDLTDFTINLGFKFGFF